MWGPQPYYFRYSRPYFTTEHGLEFRTDKAASILMGHSRSWACLEIQVVSVHSLSSPTDNRKFSDWRSV